jgi:hypothetical protein
VERVEVKDVSLAEAMKRSMSRQTEAERERRARIIGADGEYQAARKLAHAASVLAADPAALQLRLRQTVAEVAAEKNSSVTIVPVPVEVLRFLDRGLGGWPGPSVSAGSPASAGRSRGSRPARECWPAVRASAPRFKAIAITEVEPASRSAVANLHAVSMRSPRDLGRSPFISALALAFARVGGLITSSHSLSGFGSCCAVDRGAAALVDSARLAR